MSLPQATPGRERIHRRSIQFDVFRRPDGLWEVDARLSDVKTVDALIAGGTRAAGVPVHDLLLRLVIDADMNVLEAGSASPHIPYYAHCGDHDNAYAVLVGLNLMRGFRRAVQERLGGVRACTHITEMSQQLPSAVLQAFAGVVIDTRGTAPDAAKPFQLDRCHALATTGEVVRLHYPRWAAQPGQAADPGRQPHAKNAPDNPEVSA